MDTLRDVCASVVGHRVRITSADPPIDRIGFLTAVSGHDDDPILDILDGRDQTVQASWTQIDRLQVDPPQKDDPRRDRQQHTRHRRHIA